MATRSAWAFIGLSLVFCFIPGYSSDVPDDVVYTELHKTVQKGSRAVLTCEFYGTPLAVYWKKGDDPRTAPNLITWFGAQPQIVTGSCVADKTCEMGDHFSLIIKNTSIEDRGRYICRVSNYKGFLIHNFTDVEVFEIPDPTLTSVISQDDVTSGPDKIYPSPTTLSSVVKIEIPDPPLVSMISQDDVTSGPNASFPSSWTPSSVIKIVVPIFVVFGLLLTVALYMFYWDNRQAEYRVSDKEKLLNRDKDDGKFDEYKPSTGADDEPLRGSQGSLNDSEHGSSETDSLKEYADGETGKFDEEGSYIGPYGDNNKQRQPDDEQGGGAAYSTFI